jgi:serine O-acetyltransferase
MLAGLVAYLDSIKSRDPAPRSRWEVLLYPGVLAVGLHRIAHWLFRASSTSSLARQPPLALPHRHRYPSGAMIGRNFFIDHGFVVIGETR